MKKVVYILSLILFTVFVLSCNNGIQEIQSEQPGNESPSEGEPVKTIRRIELWKII